MQTSDQSYRLAYTDKKPVPAQCRRGDIYYIGNTLPAENGDPKPGRPAVIVVHGEMFGVAELHAAARLRPGKSRAGAEQQRCQRKQNAKRPPHGAASRLFESKRRV